MPYNGPLGALLPRPWELFWEWGCWGGDPPPPVEKFDIFHWQKKRSGAFWEAIKAKKRLTVLWLSPSRTPHQHLKQAEQKCFFWLWLGLIIGLRERCEKTCGHTGFKTKLTVNIRTGCRDSSCLHYAELTIQCNTSSIKQNKCGSRDEEMLLEWGIIQANR